MLVATTVALALAFVLHFGGQRTAEADPDTVLPGYDLSQNLSFSANLSFPAGFFDAGCEAFSGDVSFIAQPIADFGGYSVFPAHAVTQRKAPAGPAFPATIPSGIKRLKASSAIPITVNCPGGPQSWNVDFEVPEGDMNQVQGTMTIRHEGPNGGTFDFNLPLRPLITVIRKNDLHAFAPFYYPPPPNAPVFKFAGTNLPWCHQPAPFSLVVPGLTSNFFPLVVCPPKPTATPTATNTATRTSTRTPTATPTKAPLPPYTFYVRCLPPFVYAVTATVYWTDANHNPIPGSARSLTCVGFSAFTATVIPPAGAQDRHEFLAYLTPLGAVVYSCSFDHLRPQTAGAGSSAGSDDAWVNDEHTCPAPFGSDVVFRFSQQTASSLGGTAAYPDLSSGGNAGLLAGASGAAMAVVLLGGAAWYARRRWVR